MASLDDDLHRAATAAIRRVGPSLGHLAGLKRLSEIVDPPGLRRIRDMEAQIRRLANPPALQRMRDMEAQIQRLAEPRYLRQLQRAAEGTFLLRDAVHKGATAQRLLDRFADQDLIRTVIGIDERVSAVVGTLQTRVDGSLVGRIADIMGHANKFSTLIVQIERNVAAVKAEDDLAEQFYFKPEGPGLLGSPADETPMEPHDVRHREEDVALGIERIEAATTLSIRSVRSAWAGLRSFVADHRPVNGWDDSVPGFYWLAGQGGSGIKTSPAMGLYATAMVLERTPPAGFVEAGLNPEALGVSRLGAQRL